MRTIQNLSTGRIQKPPCLRRWFLLCHTDFWANLYKLLVKYTTNAKHLPVTLSTRAVDRIRTGDLFLGKEAFYQLNYYRGRFQILDFRFWIFKI